ncbi:MAG: TonB-dependent receptor [Zoogloeaceae bacterium]|nr:TonB-dependent receptor [Zoogloeaceae bacterium]
MRSGLSCRCFSVAGWIGCVASLHAIPVAAATADVDGLLALPLEQLLQIEVTGASRYQQPSNKAPAAVTVITREQIRAHAWRNLAELLDSVPGVFSTGDRAYSYLGVRGFQLPSDYNSNVLLLVDGTPLNDGVYNQAFLGDEGIVDLALIDRVEFIAGPGSSMYGSNAIFGVINVITRSGSSLPGTSVEVSAASNGGRGAAARYGYSDDARDLLLSVSEWREDGERFTLPPASGRSFGRTAADAEHERGRRVALRYQHENLTLLGLWAEREKGYATAPYGTEFGTSQTRFRDTQWFVSLGHQDEASPGLTVASKIGLGESRYRGTWVYAPEDGGLNRDDSASRWWHGSLQATDTRHQGHTLVYGIDMRNDYRVIQRNRDLDAAPGDFRLNDRRKAWHVGAFLQDEWAFADGWRLNAGLRADKYDSFGLALSPRLALIQEFSSRTTLKYLYGRAYRAPNPYELYYHDGEETMAANPLLDPERVESFEFVVEHRDATGRDWRWSLYRNSIRNLIVQTDNGSGLLVYRNLRDATLYGSTLAVRQRWSNGASVATSVSWHHAEDADSKRRLSHSPQGTAKLDASMPLGSWQITLEGRYLGARKTLSGKVGGQSWANLALVADNKVLAGAKVALRVSNLFDRTLYDPASDEFDHDRLPRKGREVSASLTWSF